jgi:hypothetical protein
LGDLLKAADGLEDSRVVFLLPFLILEYENEIPLNLRSAIPAKMPIEYLG